LGLWRDGHARRHAGNRTRAGASRYRAYTGAAGDPTRPGVAEGLIGRTELRRRRRRGLRPVAPVVLLVVRLVLSRGITWGPRMTGDWRSLIGRGGVSRLLRRWRIPRVIRHVAKSLFLYLSVSASRRLGSTVAA